MEAKSHFAPGSPQCSVSRGGAARRPGRPREAQVAAPSVQGRSFTFQTPAPGPRGAQPPRRPGPGPPLSQDSRRPLPARLPSPRRRPGSAKMADGDAPGAAAAAAASPQASAPGPSPPPGWRERLRAGLVGTWASLWFVVGLGLLYALRVPLRLCENVAAGERPGLPEARSGSGGGGRGGPGGGGGQRPKGRGPGPWRAAGRRRPPVTAAGAAGASRAGARLPPSALPGGAAAPADRPGACRPGGGVQAHSPPPLAGPRETRPRSRPPAAQPTETSASLLAHVSAPGCRPPPSCFTPVLSGQSSREVSYFYFFVFSKREQCGLGQCRDGAALGGGPCPRRRGARHVAGGGAAGPARSGAENRGGISVRSWLLHQMLPAPPFLSHEMARNTERML